MIITIIHIRLIYELCFCKFRTTADERPWPRGRTKGEAECKNTRVPGGSTKKDSALGEWILRAQSCTGRRRKHEDSRLLEWRGHLGGSICGAAGLWGRPAWCYKGRRGCVDEMLEPASCAFVIFLPFLSLSLACLPVCCHRRRCRCRKLDAYPT